MGTQECGDGHLLSSPLPTCALPLCSCSRPAPSLPLSLLPIAHLPSPEPPNALSTPHMASLDLPEPPTQATISQARAQLLSLHDSSRHLEARIADAREALARIVDERTAALRELERELAAVEDRVALTKAYVSPIKRLPRELLRQIFLFNFEDCAWSAWVLSAVCALWRKVALGMPTLWSKVRFLPLRRLSLHCLGSLCSFHCPSACCGSASYALDERCVRRVTGDRTRPGPRPVATAAILASFITLCSHRAGRLITD